MTLDVSANKTKFKELCLKYIQREGIKELLYGLETTDFYAAPASTKYHLNREGGLCQHSLNVYGRLNQNLQSKLEYSPENLAICALLHDLCKTNYYATEYRNVKQPNGAWVREPYYAVKDSLPYGHGEKSVYLISKHLRLTDDEAMAIRWHMGAFDEAYKGGSFALNRAFETHPLALHLHIADLQAAYLDEIE